MFPNTLLPEQGGAAKEWQRQKEADLHKAALRPGLWRIYFNYTGQTAYKKLVLHLFITEVLGFFIFCAALLSNFIWGFNAGSMRNPKTSKEVWHRVCWRHQEALFLVLFLFYNPKTWCSGSSFPSHYH